MNFTMIVVTRMPKSDSRGPFRFAFPSSQLLSIDETTNGVLMKREVLSGDIDRFFIAESFDTALACIKKGTP